MHEFLLWARHCVLKILTSLGLIWCQTQSKPAIKMSDGMKPPINQRFSSNRLSPFSHLKLCERSGRSAGFLTFAFSHIVIHFLVFASDRQKYPLGISVSSFHTRPWGFQVPPKIIYLISLLCKRPGVLQLGLPSSRQATRVTVLWSSFLLS